MPFFGQILTKDGLKPDPHKVDVIQQWPTPTCVTELLPWFSELSLQNHSLSFRSETTITGTTEIQE